MKKTILALALSLSLAAGSVQAETISFNFSGHWGTNEGDVPTSLNKWFLPEGIFEGVIRYDMGIEPVAGGSQTKTQYKGSNGKTTSTMTFVTNGWEGTVTNPLINVVNGDSPSSSFNDQIIIDFFPAIDGISSVIFSSVLPAFVRGAFSLIDSDNTVFSDTSLPRLDSILRNSSSSTLVRRTSLPLPFELGMFTLQFFDDDSKFVNVLGSVDSISPQPVPEPTAFLLFATGLTGLVTYRRRRGH